MDNIHVPVSPGEVLGKITILEIKSERMSDPQKVANVRVELALLKETWSKAVTEDDVVHRLHDALKEINEKLWEIHFQIALQREMDLPGQVTLEMLAGQRELISVEESEETLDEAWAELEPALVAALDALATMRCQEGAALTQALRRHLDEIESVLSRVLGRTSDLVTAHRSRLRERVADLLDGRLPDPLRLEQEVALLAERGDVAEECDRLRSHLAQFRETLDQSGPQGRRLDFLLQEMNREANTIGSKAADASLAQDVVELKTAIERLREQVQNIE